MSYVHSVLQPGETVLAIARRHWVAYLPAMGLGILTAVLLISAQGSRGGLREISWCAATALAVAAAISFAKTWFIKWATELAVTNRRLIYKFGFIRRHTIEMNIDKIETVNVDQSILGRLFDFGTIHVLGTGQGIEHLHMIAAPLHVRNAIAAR